MHWEDKVRYIEGVALIVMSAKVLTINIMTVIKSRFSLIQMTVPFVWDNKQKGLLAFSNYCPYPCSSSLLSKT